jgi:hypothetical protein
VLEKASFGVAAAVLYLQGRVTAPLLGLGTLDLTLGLLFLLSYLKTGREQTAAGGAR